MKNENIKVLEENGFIFQEEKEGWVYEDWVIRLHGDKVFDIYDDYVHYEGPVSELPDLIEDIIR